MPLRGGGRVGRLMANTILNFHFDYWNPSLRQLSVLWAIIGFKMNDIINGDIFVMIEIESFCSKSILPCYLLLFCYCIITRVSTTMLSNFYADLNAEEGAKSLMAMWLLILILLFFCFVMWSSDLKKKTGQFLEARGWRRNIKANLFLHKQSNKVFHKMHCTTFYLVRRPL